MRTTLSHSALLLVALFASQAQAQKVGVVVMASESAKAPLAGKVTEAIEGAVATSHELVHWRDVLATSSSSATAAQATLKKKTQEVLGFIKSNDAAHAPVADLDKAMRAAAPSATMADIQAAQAAMGAIAWAAGDAALAEQRIVDALSYDVSLQPLEVSEPAGFASLWERAKFAVADHARGELSITSDPEGARAVVDGVTKGRTPLVVQGLTTGPHLVQLDHFGYALAGEIVKVSGAEASYKTRLGLTDLISEENLKNALVGATRNDRGAHLGAVCEQIELDDVIAGWMTPKGSSVLLSLAAIQCSTGRVLAAQDLLIEKDEFIHAGPRAASIVNALLEGKTAGAKGAADKKEKPRDPLEGKDGTEDW